MKPFKIAVGVHGRPSTFEIFQKLERKECQHVIKARTFEGFVIRENPENIKSKRRVVTREPLDCKGAIVVRWGWYGNIDTDKASIVYNKSEAIKLVNDKGGCRKFLEKSGIAVPKTYLVGELNGKEVYPLIGRPTHHGRGKDFYVCQNAEEVKGAIGNGCTYFSEVYPKTEEYRVHCALGKVLEIMKKPQPADIKQIAWNRALNDAPFTRVKWADWEIDVCKTALNACKATGLDISGVDVMVQRDNKDIPQVVICELNTAPTLNSSPHVLGRYTKLFNKLARNDKRVQHWDFNKFKEVNSLAWKEDQLSVD